MHKRLLFPMLLVGLLAACGFHLRGAAGLPEVFSATWLEVPDHYTEFSDALRAQLTGSGAVLVTGPTAARVTVRVRRDEVGVRVLSVSARNTPREYEVVYSVVVTASADGREILAAEPLTLTRNYAFDEAEVLVKDAEDRDIRHALAGELASLVVYRLAAAARNPPGASSVMPAPEPAPSITAPANVPDPPVAPSSSGATSPSVPSGGL